jgi:hypothetical protein
MKKQRKLLASVLALAIIAVPVAAFATTPQPVTNASLGVGVLIMDDRDDGVYNDNARAIIDFGQHALEDFSINDPEANRLEQIETSASLVPVITSISRQAGALVDEYGYPRTPVSHQILVELGTFSTPAGHFAVDPDLAIFEGVALDLGGILTSNGTQSADHNVRGLIADGSSVIAWNTNGGAQSFSIDTSVLGAGAFGIPYDTLPNIGPVTPGLEIDASVSAELTWTFGPPVVTQPTP